MQALDDPVRRGTYVLVFELQAPVENKLGRFSGQYCYVGSARGPGGVQARIRRHLRKQKAKRWHIDLLTDSNRFTPLSIYVAGKHVECAVAGELMSKLEGHPGFGCSDCRCPSHLFKLNDVHFFEAAMRRMGLRKLDSSSLHPLSGKLTGRPDSMLR